MHTEVQFSGPFSWIKQASLPEIWQATGLIERPGIYVMTIALPAGHLPYYVGESKSLFERLSTHYEKTRRGEYRVFEPDAFARGERVQIWPGVFRNAKTPAQCKAALPQLWPAIQAKLRSTRLFIAPLDCDPRTRVRIEAEIAQPLQWKGGRWRAANPFQDDTVCYRPKTASEAAVECRLTLPAPIMGLREGTFWA